jgi:hypothetical protein
VGFGERVRVEEFVCGILFLVVRVGVVLDGVGTVRKQTGIWVDAGVWEAYREVCRRERLRPGEPVEGFLGFVLRGGSALNALSMMRTMMEARFEGLEAYARVLLDWLRKGVYSVMTVDEDEVSVEYMLLQALKQVTDQELQTEVEGALKNSRGKVDGEESCPVVAVQAAEVEDDESRPDVERSIEEIKQRIADLKRVKELIRRRHEKRG